MSTALQPLQGVATSSPINMQSQLDLTFLLTCLESTAPSVGQMYGEGGAAVAEIAVQAFQDRELDDQPAIGPALKRRGKALLTCPEHHQLVFRSKRAFKEHVESHDNEFRCPQEGCRSNGHVFKSLRLLYRHVSRSHGAELVGRESLRFQCGHCDKALTLIRRVMLTHLQLRHLKAAERRKIRNPGEVEQFCLPPEEPSSRVRTFTLAPQFVKGARRSSKR